ncbi:phosphoribosylformylglycinamidine synthase subunit PurQ [Desulfonatronovibrio hydrogenovorans]|uniref:phosphoribosylformylglycinamidine synthase subunit PurQ n=1 Tax=Desulfonatronovibrio hydrogenovorans TaxID=53245 RepID=UPI00048E2665|nr:phosphoribosylformylglycinamidine synthase subunit PurQ [Desulfonatronovibrio hydrogenovorans]
MTKVKTLVVTGYGTNCERETAHAARLGGADTVDICYFSDLVVGKSKLNDYNFLIFPGGFLDGDDLGAAQAAALRWKYSSTDQGSRLIDDLRAFYDSGRIILGICNGFQLLVKLGLLPAAGGKSFERQVSLTHNDSARFEDRWVHLKANPDSPCVFLKGIDYIFLPVRHGEGKLVTKNDQLMADLVSQQLIALQYIDPRTKEPTQEYPLNPNGSPLAIAGLTDPTGRVLGLMPHPEAFNHPTNHPAWTRGARSTPGTEIIASGIRYLRGGF